MIIATLWEQHISIHFSYLPAWELFASMHVLQQPLHHEEQQEFVRHVEAGHAELVAEVREWEKGVLLTTHYIREAEELCDYICFWSMVQNAWDMTNQERRGGTLEITFLSPASRLAMCYGRTLGALIQQVWMFGCFCLFVLFYAGAIRLQNWYLLPVMFVLLLVSSTIWGGLVSVVFLFSRDAEIVLNFLETPMMLFSGTRIPVSCFPRWGRALSLIFPLTYCLSLIRLVLGVSEGSSCWQRELLILGLMLLLLFVATVLLLRRAEAQNRRTGELQFF